MGYLEVLHRMLEQLSVVVNEIARGQLSDKLENEATRLAQARGVYDQTIQI